MTRIMTEHNKEIRTIVNDLSRHRRQRRKLVRGRLRVLARQPAHERALADRGEADEADTGDARPGHVEARAAAAAAAAGGEQLALQLGQLRLELAQVVGRCLVLLSLGHLL